MPRGVSKATSSKRLKSTIVKVLDFSNEVRKKTVTKNASHGGPSNDINKNQNSAKAAGMKRKSVNEDRNPVIKRKQKETKAEKITAKGKKEIRTRIKLLELRMLPRHNLLRMAMLLF